MTNKEYLESLKVEELVQTIYFDCPYSLIERQTHNLCKKDIELERLYNAEQIANFVFSGKQRKICNECKLSWLHKENRYEMPHM